MPRSDPQQDINNTPSLKDILKQKIPIATLRKEENNQGHVYFLIDDTKIVYVGSTRQGLARLFAHISKNAKIFDSFFMFPCNKTIMEDVENRYILKFAPKYNKQIRSKRYVSINKLKRLYGMRKKQIQNIIVKHNIKTTTFIHDVVVFKTGRNISKQRQFIFLDKQAFDRALSGVSHVQN